MREKVLDRSMCSANRYQSLLLSVAVVFFIGILLSFPVRNLVADYYYNRVVDILDDKSTEYLDIKTISGDSIADYKDAMRSIEKAVVFVPSKSIYYKSLSDVYVKFGMWAESMTFMKEPLPTNAVAAKDAFENAIKYLTKAISIEPANPDYHLALAQLYAATNAIDTLIEKEFARVINASPVNVPLRYAIAKHYLLAGKNREALEHVRILASIDDSYIMPESIQKRLMAERMTPAYLSLLSESYLFKSLEIAWMVSKNPEVVKGIVPDNLDAREVIQLFLEWKGIEE